MYTPVFATVFKCLSLPEVIMPGTWQIQVSIFATVFKCLSLPLCPSVYLHLADSTTGWSGELQANKHFCLQCTTCIHDIQAQDI